MRQFRAGTVNSGSGPLATSSLVTSLGLITTMVFISVVVLVVAVQSWNAGPKIQALKGDIGPIGPEGPAGACNLSSTNSTFVGTGLDLSGNLSIGDTILFSPNGSISFNNASNCVEIKPKLCISEIANSDGNGSVIFLSNLTIPNGAISLSQLNFGSDYLFYNEITYAFEFVGAPVQLTLVPPIYVGGAGYLTNNSNELLIYGTDIISFNATTTRFYSFLEFLLPIIAPTTFWGNITLPQPFLILFGNTTGAPTIGSQSGILVINGPSGLEFVGNITIDNSIISNIKLDQKIIFNQNGAKIYASGSCLVLEAPSLCFNASNTIFSSPVQFTQPIVGNVTINGSLIVTGTINLPGSMTFANLTVTNVLNSTNATFVKTLYVSDAIVTSTTSVVSIAGTLLSTSTSSISSAGNVNFVSANISAISCSQPFFDPNHSGCTTLCINHSACSDQFNSLIVNQDVRIQGNIVQNSSAIPHQCCTGMGSFNFLYQRWSTTLGGSFFDNGPPTTFSFYDLSFSTDETPSLTNGATYINFGGGSSWTVPTTALYQITMSVDIDTDNDAILALVLLCGGNQVFSSPTFNGYNAAAPFPTPYILQTIVTYQHAFEAKIVASSVCIFKLAYSDGTVSLSVGNKLTLSIKLLNFE